MIFPVFSSDFRQFLHPGACLSGFRQKKRRPRVGKKRSKGMYSPCGGEKNGENVPYVRTVPFRDPDPGPWEAERGKQEMNQKMRNVE